ncbi:GNAT family N-acetyltransferase [Halobacteriales archaeon QH_7_66_36]|nr:MAG: GNAT family N-acetyltransferase [Halobacteriales archaeon QH_7_66_36]
MEFVVVGWHPAETDTDDGPRLRLDWRRFSYAGKFVMTNTGKAILREGDAGADEFDESVLAAVAFNEDRTDDRTLWLRYVTVREDVRGEGLGPRLCDEVAERALARGYDRLRIAVNNPFAYEALYKAGFGFTGRTTGLAELVLDRPSARDPDRYRAGLERFSERDLTDAERSFLDEREGPPER